MYVETVSLRRKFKCILYIYICTNNFTVSKLTYTSSLGFNNAEAHAVYKLQ